MLGRWWRRYLAWAAWVNVRTSRRQRRQVVSEAERIVADDARH